MDQFLRRLFMASQHASLAEPNQHFRGSADGQAATIGTRDSLKISRRHGTFSALFGWFVAPNNGGTFWTNFASESTITACSPYTDRTWPVL